MKNRFLVVLVLLLATAINAAAAAQQVVEIDLRNRSEDGAFSLVFLARDASVTSFGHAWVGWGTEDEVQLASVWEAFGLYPSESDKAKAAFGGVPGEIQPEGFAAGTTALIVRVNSDVFETARAIRIEWARRLRAGDIDYNLYERNCIDFASAVATAVGLAVPQDTLLPQAFMKRLVEMNRQDP